VDSVSKAVGLDNLQDFTDGYDVLWDFNQKYIRFNTAPTSGANIQISGLPLLPIIVRARDEDSVAQVGEYHYRIIDKSIKSKQAARDRAKAELRAYGSTLKSGKFQTIKSGLRSGQTINVQSTIRGLDQDYLINRVDLRLQGPNNPMYTVTLASSRVFGIVDLLQRQITSENEKIVISQDEVLEKLETIDETVTMSEQVGLDTETQITETQTTIEDVRQNPFGTDTPPTWVAGSYVPTGGSDPKRSSFADRGNLIT